MPVLHPKSLWDNAELFEPDPVGNDMTEMVNSVNRAQGIYQTVFVSSLVLYIIAIMTCLLLTLIVAIVRFYQGMYTHEGYLSHTLPVTPAQHIWAKLLVSLIFTVGSLFAIFLSVMVITIGEVNTEIFKAFGYYIGKLFNNYGAEGALYIVEALVLVFAAQIMCYFKLYCCISVGQLAKKHKLLAAFGVFFGIYVLTQIVGTAIIISTLFYEQPWIISLFEWLGNTRAGVHVVFCSGIVFYSVFALIYFMITKHIMSKKLNLS